VTNTEAAYHLVGTGGIGMSAIARLLLARGARVSGSDLRRTPLIDELEREGMRIAIGHGAANLEGADVVVVSSAIATDNPELIAAVERRLDVVTRGKMLARLAEGHRLVAVAGTHGKTTTTAMIATIFERAGLDPTVAVGGVRTDTGSNARAGGGHWFVTESDESDGSFLELQPTIAVVTNIENDHIASDAELPQLLAQFATFVSKVPPQGRAVIGTDNAASAVLAREARAPVATFATRADAELVATEITYADLGSRFVVRELGTALGTVVLNVPGEINVQNALAALCTARAAGVPFEPTALALAEFHGVHRRFQVVGRGAFTVVDDYAHHPTAIEKTIAAARGLAGEAPVYVAFQPHRFTRTNYLKDGFAAALRGADRVFLVPVYAASEAPIAGVSARSIGEPLAASGTPVSYVDDVEALLDVLPREVPAGALVLMLGAGSISGVAHRLGERIAATPIVR
jgi:UDP-N-acetylmuramate--alanine ligase